MDKKGKGFLNILGIVIVALVSAFFVFKFNGVFLELASSLAVKSAARYLPSAVSIPGETEKSKTVNKTVDETEEEQTEPEETTKAVSKPMTKQEEDFYSVPGDILEMIEAAKEKAASDKKDGAISEITYTNEGVTNKSGVVKVKNTNKTQIDVAKLLEEKADLSAQKDKPAVLIFHTHTTESYQTLDRDFYAVGSTSRDNDLSKNMVRVGDAICEELEKAGYIVIHDKNIYDKKYNGAYSRSREAVAETLKKYPSIQVTLDIHRDAIQTSNGTKIKPTANLDGKKAAQVMIISGCQEEGNGIEDFPDWRYNLIFALKLQQKMEEAFPSLTRPVFFCPRRYNMNMTRCSLLLEVGSDSNTLEEAYISGKCIGKALSDLLEDYTQ